MQRVLGIIPSRLESTRVPKKPLKDVLGLPLILHVYERAKRAKLLTDLIVATDSQDIVSLVEAAGGKAMLTSIDHKNGTERMHEVQNAMPDFDYYTLINGDEILLNPDSIDVSINLLLTNSEYDASILAVPFTKSNSPFDFKVVLNSKSEVMYISRSDIPSGIRNQVDFRLKAYHLMTFKPQTIRDYFQLEKSKLEHFEDHEHLRLLESGYRIICDVVNDKCISLDTIEDIETITSYLKTDSLFHEYIGRV